MKGKGEDSGAEVSCAACLMGAVNKGRYKKRTQGREEGISVKENNKGME